MAYLCYEDHAYLIIPYLPELGEWFTDGYVMSVREIETVMGKTLYRISTSRGIHFVAVNT